MVERIKTLIEKQKLTATQFAEEIGVQRSAVSHLLSGRNKPSLDFMLKIKNRFPEVNLDWLLLGSGKMVLSTADDKNTIEKDQKELFQEEIKLETNEQIPVQSEVKESEIPFNMVKSEDAVEYKNSATKTEQSPQKVILLFSDNTFKVFNAH